MHVARGGPRACCCTMACTCCPPAAPRASAYGHATAVPRPAAATAMMAARMCVQAGLLWLLRLSGGAVALSEIDLDATPWDFSCDPTNVGEADRWYSVAAQPTFSGSIRTPGAWQAQGIGNETALETRQYIGVGWYRKTVVLDKVPPGGSVWLWIGGAPGGVMRSAKVWANGVLVGRHVGYLEPLELDLTAAVASGGAGPGKVVLAVAVDSCWDKTEDPLWGAGSMWNPGGVGPGGFGGDGYSFGGYGGIVGNARLLIRQRAWLGDSVHSRCHDTGTGGTWRCAIDFAVAGATHASDRAGVTVCEWQGGAGSGGAGRSPPACVTAAAGGAAASAGARHTLSVTIPSARLWIPGTPAVRANLYVANLTLRGADGLAATRATRFGVRSLSVDGPQILFNGEPLFLRGYGDDSQYWFTAAPPMEKGYYMAQLADMRALGYNFIRLHTHSMPDVFHEAADELGILCDPEFAMSYSYPNPFGSPASAAVKGVFNRSFASLVQRRAAHPSVFGWVLSNEVHWAATSPSGQAQFAELYRFAKAFDPDRPCWYGDGSTIAAGMNLSALGCRDGSDPTDGHCFMDVWVAGSAYVCGPTSSWRTLGATDIRTGVPVAEMPVPLILHEAVDARTFPRIKSTMQAFEGGLLKAGVIYNQTILRLRELGLWDESDRWALASEKAYSMFMKSYIENYRADPAISGYEWWLGFDYVASSNGVIGGHANNPRPKPGISNSTLASTQQNVVLLVAEPVALQTTGRRPGEFVPIEVLCSNFTFGGFPAWHGRAATLVWAAAVDDGRVLGNGTIDVSGVSVVQGTTGPIAVVGVDVPLIVEEAMTVSVTVTLHLGADILVATNQWDLAVFPPRAATMAQQCPVAVFSDPALLAAARQVCPNATAVSPQVLAAQTAPFVLLRHGGVPDVATVAALRSAGGFALLLNPTVAGNWPVCSGGGTAVGPPAEVPLAQPWWLSNQCWPKEQSWMTGTLVYNTSLTSRAFGRAAVKDGFLAWPFGRLMMQSHVYTLDTLSAAMAASVHIRAIPSDGLYPVGSSGYQTMVANSALVWEGRIPAFATGSGSGAGRFLVSGLNLFNGSKVLQADAAAEHVFDQLLTYAVAEAAATPTQQAVPRAQHIVTSAATRGCNVSGSFCTAGSEQRCRQPLNGSKEGLCNANFEIVAPACLHRDGTVDSLYIQVKVRAAGIRVIGLVYDTADAPPVEPDTNASFCAAASPKSTTVPGPRRLVAKGSAVTAAAGVGATTWLRLPLPATPLPAGIYYIGILADADLDCYSGAAASAPGPAPAIGPGAPDKYVARPFGAGPGLGPELRWIAGSVGLSMYATTVAAADSVPLVSAVPDSDEHASFPCEQVQASQQFPSYHIMDNLTRNAVGSLSLEGLNDANAIFMYQGVLHVMCQGGGSKTSSGDFVGWTHAVSEDMVRFRHLKPALISTASSSWDNKMGPCDGTVSFPDLGHGPFNGTTPLIIYGPDCNQRGDETGLRAGGDTGDVPRMEPATPADPTDALLTDWVKTVGGPMAFEGTPCSFPGRVWRSKVGAYFNMLCAWNGLSSAGLGWSRYTTTDQTLMQGWKLADLNFTDTPALANWSQSGAMFSRIPNTNTAAGGPTHMLDANNGSGFWLGKYDAQTEKFHVDVSAGLQQLDNGPAYGWAAMGNAGPDPDAEIGRLLTIGWYWPLPYLSLVREISYDHGTQQLVTNPIAEYAKLRTGAIFENQSVGKLAPKQVHTLPVSATQAGAVDVLLSLNVSMWAADTTAAFGFNRSCSRGCEPFVVLFDVGATDADGGRTVKVTNPNKVPGTPAPNCVGHYGIPHGCEPGHPRESVRVLRGEALTARFMVDGPLLEVFVQGGRLAFSLRYIQYPAAPQLNASAVHVFNQRHRALVGVVASAFHMGCGWV